MLAVFADILQRRGSAPVGLLCVRRNWISWWRDCIVAGALWCVYVVYKTGGRRCGSTRETCVMCVVYFSQAAAAVAIRTVTVLLQSAPRSRHLHPTTTGCKRSFLELKGLEISKVILLQQRPRNFSPPIPKRKDTCITEVLSEDD